MDTLPTVSVKIPNYNGEIDLPDLLESLRSQIYPCDRVEYLLVDNGSQDQTWPMLQAAAEKERLQQGCNPGLNLRVLQETTIQSSYAARNRGIYAAHAPILVFTDADCRPEPQWLVHLIQGFESSPEGAIGWVAGEVSALKSSNWLEQYAERAETLSQKHTLSHTFSPYGQTANLAVRRECFQQVGGFRPYLTTGGDADLCWRILQGNSWHWHFAPSAIVRHRHRSTLPDLLGQWRRYGKSNRFLHDLHGVELMERPKLSYYGYRVLRWGLKELPIAAIKRQWLETLSTPIGLLCMSARWQGQAQAKLAENAHQISSVLES